MSTSLKAVDIPRGEYLTKCLLHKECSINVNNSYYYDQDARSSDDQKDEIPVENYVAQRYIENPYLIGGEMAASAQNSVCAAWLLSPPRATSSPPSPRNPILSRGFKHPPDASDPGFLSPAETSPRHLGS